MIFSDLEFDEIKSGNKRQQPLPAGQYDAVLSAIIFLGRQINQYDVDHPKYVTIPHSKPVQFALDGNGQKIVLPPRVTGALDLLFELPNELVEVNGEKLPRLLLKKDITCYLSDRSNFAKIINALTKSHMGEDDLRSFVKSPGGIESLLGKAVILNVNTYDTKYGNTFNGIRDILELNIRLEKLAESEGKPIKPVREPFIFSVSSPDLTIFRDKISKARRDKIMSAVNVGEFPEELHKAYAEIKERESQQQQEYESKKSNNGNNQQYNDVLA